MLKKIGKFLVQLLPTLKKLIPIPHSSVVALGCKNVKQSINKYVEKHGASEIVYLITASILLLCCLSLLVFFILLFIVMI